MTRSTRSGHVISGVRLRRLIGPAALLLVLAVAGPAYAAQGGAAAPLPPPAASVTFDHGVIVDPIRLVDEPNIAIDSKGGVYTSGPDGTPTQLSVFWKSDDRGVQFHPIGVVPEYKQNSVLGGGDTEITIDARNNVYMSDLQGLACQSTFASTDQGRTFTTGEACLPASDRQWMATYTDSKGATRIYLMSNELALGCYLMVSTDGGHTYLPTAPATAGVVSSNRCDGKFVVDPHDGTIYLPTGGGAIVKSTDGGVTFTHVGDTGAQANLFASLSEDAAGNLYQAWTDVNGGVFLSISKNHGVDWTQQTVNTGHSLKQFLLPWAVAGDAGRVAVVYVATTDAGKTGGYPGTPASEWNVYASISTNATAARPVFTQVRVSEHAMRRGAICTGGFPGCSINNADRTVADFFEVDRDADGRLFIAYNDCADQSSVSKAGKSIVMVARQRTGPGLLARRADMLPLDYQGPVTAAAKLTGRTVKLTGSDGLPAGNWATDPTGDAIWPLAPASGVNDPALDITRAAVADDGHNLIFKMSLADLSQAAQAAAVSSAGAPDWVFTWYDPATFSHYFVSWKGGPVFTYGTVGAIDWPALGSPAPKFLTYTPAGQATGVVGAKDVTISVPLSAVGSPKAGSKLDTITAYTWSEKGPLPSVVDAARPFSYVIGSPSPVADGVVQVSFDDPGFAHPAVAQAAGSTWSLTRTLAPGRHRVYVRQVLSAALHIPGTWPDVVAGPVVAIDLTVR